MMQWWAIGWTKSNRDASNRRRQAAQKSQGGPLFEIENTLGVGLSAFANILVRSTISNRN